MKLQIHKIIFDTTAEGFGHRTCIWVQGCHRKCPGCMAVRTWDPKAGTEMDTEEILLQIEEQKDLEGITFLGGEPFEQSEPLAEIAEACKRKGLSVIAFSGFTLEELQESVDKSVQRLLKQVDLLIDGPYKKEQRDFGRPWAGSRNQRFHFLSECYNAEMLKQQKNRLEIRITPGGSITINGMTDFEKTMEGKQDGTI